MVKLIAERQGVILSTLIDNTSDINSVKIPV